MTDAGVGRVTAGRWRIVRRVTGALAILAVGVGVIVAPGVDEREIRADDASVWALQSTSGQRFGRVNTQLGEVDTVKAVTEPSELAQHQDSLLVFSRNLSSVTQLQTSRPTDIDDSTSDAAVATPLGTTAIDFAGDVVGYLTDGGDVLAGRVSDGSAIAPTVVDPYAQVEVAEGQDRPQFRADVMTVGVDGDVAAFSVADGNVMRGRADGTSFASFDAVPRAPEGDQAHMTMVGGDWVLLDSDTGQLWRRGGEAPIATGARPGALLQRPSAAADAVYIADEYGIIAVAMDLTGARRIYGSTDVSLGEPAAPAATADPDAAMVGAWLPAGAGPGTLWDSSGKVAPLDYGVTASGGGSLGDSRSLELRSNGSRLILNENRTGWVWNVPSGQLVPSSQQWVPSEDPVVEAQDDETAERVSDPRAPKAEDDAFGVRAGRQVILPALLNDHDANEDILTIVSSEVSPLTPTFGTVSVSDDDQSLVVNVAPDATGTATFTYVITDGTASDGLRSVPATVTLTVKAPDVNSPPVWCGVNDCLTDWPSPQVSPGGTVQADALAGWVDPEGDPIYVKSATTDSPLGVVAASPEGRVVFQHTNASSTDLGVIPIDIEVSDSRGATASKLMNVTVLGDPALLTTDVAATITEGVRATIEVADNVTGAQGPLQVTEASLGPDTRARVAVAQGLIGFTFDSDAAGSYVVDYTVTDGVGEARGKARITVIAREDEQLTTVPLTAFVRAKEDVTVDVLSAISNPGGHVLLLSDVTTAPEPGALLTADVVGHSALRLAGVTEDAQPGALGVVSYTASDGTGRPQGTVRGEVTVILLNNDVPSPPLAVDDSITVRVGTQADISVLSNDVGAAGNVIALDPGSVTAAEGAGLAFPAGPRLRYLAPADPGTYVIGYSTYVLGYPAQRDTASVVVTVLANDTNAPPNPRGVTGRVASGESVRIPFDGTGIDPDGDTVSLAGIETQPVNGTATISPSGKAMIYTSASGFSGQDSFTFTVADDRGLKATATAHIGVLADDLDPSPVTYTDYVQVQVGPENRVVVTPTANDVDLAGGDLELVDIAPDAKLGTDEYVELASHIAATDMENGTVELTVGEEQGTFSFVYTVRNTGGSTAIGRIILKAVREPIADIPIIVDTVLTQENRETFADGVDVLTNKVAWGSGEVSGLTLTLWGSPDDLVVSGARISGPLPERSRLIPFQVDGLNFSGEEVTSYGFLSVPGADDFRLSLKEVFAAPQVAEGASVDFDLADFVALPPGAALEVDASSVVTSGARAEATCALVSATTLRYSAGMGEPYSDTCAALVRLADQDAWTLLPIPIVIIPEAPQPTLKGASLEVSPGGSTQFDLAAMVTWPTGAATRPVTFATSYTGEQFAVSLRGSVATVVANDRAVPGKADTVTVSLSSDPETPAVSLALNVGPAPSELPKGGAAVKTCNQADGTSCSIQVVGIPGEVNPLPGTALEIVDVTGAAECPTVTFTAATAGTVTATWTGETPGAVCNAVFSVRDAQGRVSGADRKGTISIDLQGYPAAPSELRQVAFGDGTVTLAVRPGAASSSYPSVQGFALYRGLTKVGTCDASGVCPQLAGLTNGDKQTYSATAVNAVGESRAAVNAQAWSYAAPAAPSNATWAPTKDTPSNAGNQVDLTVTVTDASTKELNVSSPNGGTRVVPVTAVGKVSIKGLNVGSNEPQVVTIAPVTGLELPPITGGQAQGAAITVTANGVGAPRINGTSWAANSDGTVATFTVTTTTGGAGSITWVGFKSAGICSVSTQASAGTSTLTAAVTPNAAPKDYVVCAESRYASSIYGSAETTVAGVYTFTDPGAPTVGEGYLITACAAGGVSCVTGSESPTVQAAPGRFEVYYGVGGAAPAKAFKAPYGSLQTVRAFNCIGFLSGATPCSQASAVVPARDGSAKYGATVSFVGCTATDAAVTADANTNDYSTTSVTWYQDAAGTVPADPDEAWQRKFARVTVNFAGNLQGLPDWSSDVRKCTDVPLEPEPDPDPDPGGGPVTP